MNASGTRNAFHLINAHANSLPIRKEKMSQRQWKISILILLFILEQIVIFRLEEMFPKNDAQDFQFLDLHRQYNTNPTTAAVGVCFTAQVTCPRGRHKVVASGCQLLLHHTDVDTASKVAPYFCWSWFKANGHQFQFSSKCWAVNRDDSGTVSRSVPSSEH